MFERLKSKLIEDCAQWWRLWSSWLAMGASTVITILWNDPTVLRDALDQIPEEYRAWLSPLVWIVAAAIPILVRLWPQPKLRKEP